MPWRSQGSGDLIPFDPKIEVTLRAPQRRARSQTREERQTEGANMDPTTTLLRDSMMPNPNAIPSRIERPPVEANNFHFNLAFITLFQQD